MRVTHISFPLLLVFAFSFASSSSGQGLSAKTSNLFHLTQTYGCTSGQSGYLEGFDYVNDNVINEKDVLALFDHLNAPGTLDYDADMFSVGIPPQVLRAFSTPVTVTVRNSGKKMWLKGEQYNLVQLTLGGRQIAPATTPLSLDFVPPNGLYTFHFNLVVPGGSTYGQVPLRFRMTRGGAQFGESVDRTVEIVAQLAPTATLTPTSAPFTPTATLTESPTATSVPSFTPSNTATLPPSGTETPTRTPTAGPPATYTATPVATSTRTSTSTPAPTGTPTWTSTPTPTRTATTPPTATPSPTPQGIFAYYPIHLGDVQRFESRTDAAPNVDYMILQATGTIQVDVGGTDVTAWVVAESGPGLRGDQFFIAKMGAQLAIVGMRLGSNLVLEAILPSPYKKAIITIVPQTLRFRNGQVIPLGDTTPDHGEQWFPVIPFNALRLSVVVPGIVDIPQFYDIAGRLEGPLDGAGPMVALAVPGPVVDARAGTFNDTIRAMTAISLRLNTMNIQGIQTNPPVLASAFGSGTFDFARGVGVVQYQKPARNNVPGEVFEFVSGTAGGGVYP